MRIRDELKKDNYWKNDRITYYEKFVQFCSTLDESGLLRSLGPNDGIHSKNIEEQITKLFTVRDNRNPDNNVIDISCLSIDQLFYLLCAVYLHDIGRFNGSIGHELNSEIRILEIRDKLGLDEFEAKAVAKICKAHAKENDVPIKTLDTNYGIGYISLNIQFLGAILRLADELDHAYTRITGLSMNSIRSKIRAVSPINERQKIEMHVSPKTNRDMMYMKMTKFFIQKVLDEVKDVFDIYSMSSPVLNYSNGVELISDNNSLPKIDESEGPPIDPTWDKIIEKIKADKKPGCEGIERATKIIAAKERGLANEEFRILFLNQELEIERKLELKKENELIESHEFSVLSVNYDPSEYGAFTTRAKSLMSKACFDPDSLFGAKSSLLFGDNYCDINQWTENIDRKIHHFLLSEQPDSDILKLRFSKIPFRWASGGVFPVINIDGNKYSFFFFRDIPPYGWNIPLGASQSHSELKAPEYLCYREFLEELLVLTDVPDNNVKYRPVEVVTGSNNKKLNISVSQEKANIFSKQHLDLRNEFDKLNLESDSDHPVIFTPLETGASVKINGVLYDNILFAINPFELGIEIVKVLECQLNNSDYLLDGEILEPVGQEKQLVRMTTALISHDYLLRNANNLFTKLKYIGNPGEQKSIKGDNFRDSEIIVFNYDVKRRREILNNPDDGRNKSRGSGDIAESERYAKWEKKYGELFPSEKMKCTPEHNSIYPPVFTPASAKMACYYFKKKYCENK